MHMAKNIFLISLGVVLGLVISVPAALFFLRTEAGQEVLRSYIVPVPEWPDVTAMLAGNVTNVSVSDALTKPLAVEVPTALVSAEYAPALNQVVQGLQRLATSSNALGPLLIEMNSRSLSGNYNGFFDLVVKAKLLLAEQHSLAEEVSDGLSALAVANQKTSDATLKSLTTQAINSASPFTRDLSTHLDLLDQLLSGKVPSTALITGINDSAHRLAQDIQAFGGDLQKLIGRLSGSAQ